MRVLILGKTRMETGVCVGGLLLDNNLSVRLIPAGRVNNPINDNHELGQVWEIEFRAADALHPPHTEDIIVTRSTLIGTQPNLPTFLRGRVNPHMGAPDGLYGGLVRFTGNGSGYIAARIGIPTFSTCFWIPDRELRRSGDYYIYTYPDHRQVRFKFVGFQAAIQTIPTGTLVRMSLARWWAPDDDPYMEERCYLQLSGWFF